MPARIGWRGIAPRSGWMVLGSATGNFRWCCVKSGRAGVLPVITKAKKTNDTASQRHSKPTTQQANDTTNQLHSKPTTQQTNDTTNQLHSKPKAARFDEPEPAAPDSKATATAPTYRWPLQSQRLGAALQHVRRSVGRATWLRGI